MQLGHVGRLELFRGGRGRKKMKRRDRDVEGKEAQWATAATANWNTVRNLRGNIFSVKGKKKNQEQKLHTGREITNTTTLIDKQEYVRK